MIPGAVRFGRGSMIQCCIFFFPPLIVDSKWHLWDTLIKQFFLLLRPGRYFKQIFLFSVFTSLFFFSETQAAFCDPQPRSRLRRKEVSLTWAAWQPLESLARALPPPLVTKFIAGLTLETQQRYRPTVPSIFVKSLHLWEPLRKMNFRPERSSRNKSLFALSLFGRAVGWEWALLVTWSGVGESHDKWCSLLTPSLGYLWLINWSEKETCWRSRGRQRQASVAVPQSGPQALVERERERKRVRKRQPSLSLSLFCLFPVCGGEKGKQPIHREWIGSEARRQAWEVSLRDSRLHLWHLSLHTGT